MSNKAPFSTSGLLIPAFLLTCGIAAAQSAEVPAAKTASPASALIQNLEQEKAGRKPTRRPTPPGRVTVIPSQWQVAPQVVTVIHRLSGVKILRFLLRQSGATGLVETIDPDTVNNDAHASIIAGWALDDGKTIAARLPQAAAELEVKEFEGPLTDQKSGLFAQTPFSLVRRQFEPDLTVVTRDGRKLKARLIGMDAETGLSVMQVIGILTQLPAQASTLPPAEGQLVQIFAPEPFKTEGEGPTFNTFVRVGKIDANVARIKQDPLGIFDKLVVQGPQLSPAVIGGVACDPSGTLWA
jgi:hypothetical protein